MSYRYLCGYSTKQKCICLLIAMILTLMLYKLIHAQYDIATAHLLIVVDTNVQLPLFQPDVISDFPVTKGDHSIPFIIHQLNKDYNVPNGLVKYVKTVVEQNPNWKYYFWTDAGGRKLIAEKLPQLLPKWDSIDKGILKADILRYVTLYEFGGAYLDLDVEVLRNLDRLTMKYPCIIPPEPFEHNALLYGTDIFLNNAILFCRPKHPFFKMVLDTLIDTADLPHEPLDATGPAMLTRVYKEYTKNMTTLSTETSLENSPYAVKSYFPLKHPNAVFIPNTQYFTENIDADSLFERFMKTCSNFKKETLLVQRACAELRHKGFVRKPNKYAFTVHQYYHSWFGFKRLLLKYFSWTSITTDIREIVEKCIIY